MGSKVAGHSVHFAVRAAIVVEHLHPVEVETALGSAGLAVHAFLESAFVVGNSCNPPWEPDMDTDQPCRIAVAHKGRTVGKNEHNKA